MKGHRRPQTVRALIGLAVGLGASQLAYAASLGPIQVNSYMGQPLKAAIRVNGLTPAQAQTASVSLADSAEYSKRGVVKTPEQSSLSFRLVPSGNAYTIAVSSNSRMNEPFVNFVLSFRSGGEVHTREYSVFLDPDPAVKAGIAPAPVSAPVAAAPVAMATPVGQAVPAAQGFDSPVPHGAQRVALTGQYEYPEPAAATGRATRAAAPAKAPARARSTDSQAHVSLDRLQGNQYGPVRQGETLFSIADAARPSHVPVRTMMRAIFNANRRAFATNSMDSLMAGQTLIIPSNVGESAAGKRSRASNDSEETRPKARQQARQEPKQATEVKEAESKVDAQLSGVVQNTVSEDTVRPVEMNPEEIAKAQAEAARLAAEQAEAQAKAEAAKLAEQAQEAEKLALEPLQAQDTEGSNTGSAMVLDTADSIGSAEQSGNTESSVVVEDTSTQPAEPEPVTVETPPSQDATPIAVPSAQPPAVVENTPAEPAAQQTPPPAKRPVAPPPPPVEEEASLFGLPLWAVAAIGGLLALLLVLGALVAIKKRKAAAQSEEMSEEEIEALAMNMSFEDEQRLAALINDEDDMPRQTHHARYDEQDEVEQSDYDTQFFSNDDAEEHSSAVSLHKSSSYEEEEQIDALDDFFADADAQAQHHALESIDVNTQEQSFEGLDDFFSDADTEQSTFSAPQAAEDDGVSFDGLDDFFTDSDESAPVAQAKPAPVEDDFADIQFDGLDDFLSESEVEAQAATPVASSSAASSDDFVDLDSMEELNFFADSEPQAEEPVVVESVADDLAAENALFADLAFVQDEVVEDVVQEAVPPAVAAVEFVEQEVKQEETSAADIEAMSITLDLASAYISGGIKPDKVAKVRGWLEEVLQKGSEEQKANAAELMSKLP